MNRITAVINLQDGIDRREFADGVVSLIGPDPSVVSMGIEFPTGNETPDPATGRLPYRGALEICQEIVAAQNKADELKHELWRLTGKDYLTFMADMRSLLAPVED